MSIIPLEGFAPGKPDAKSLAQKTAVTALTDRATELPNGRYFRQIANLEIQRGWGQCITMSMVAIGLDHFTAVNRVYGRALGDRALRHYGRACRKHLRLGDTLARLGGDVFAIFLPGVDEAGAAAVAHKLQRTLCRLRFKEGVVRLKVTASFGVAQVRAGDKTADACLGRADDAMRAAKAAGRNRTVSFSATCLKANAKEAAPSRTGPSHSPGCACRGGW